MDTEQRLKQLTAEFPGTAPPGPDRVAAVVRRGRRAAFVHRAVVTAATAVAVSVVAVVAPQVLDRPTAPVIAPPVLESPTSPPSPEPDPVPELVEALPLVIDEDLAQVKRSPAPAPEPEPAPAVEPTQAPAPVQEAPVVAVEPDPVVVAPEPEPEPSPLPALAPHEGFEVSVTPTRSAYAVGEPVALVVRACNTSDRAREQTHRRTGHRYDLWIKNAETGTWVADTTHRAHAEALEVVRWEPGQCREFVESWDATTGPIGADGGEPVPGGTYQAKVKWSGEEDGVLLDYRYSPTFKVDGPSPTVAFEGFEVTVTTDRATYGADQEVRIKVRACNTSDRAREQVLPHEGHWFDLYVRDADGQFVADTTWRSYGGSAVTVSLPAGSCETFVESWWQCEGEVGTEPTATRVRPGIYVIKVHWLGTEEGADYGWVHSPAFELTG